MSITGQVGHIAIAKQVVSAATPTSGQINASGIATTAAAPGANAYTYVKVTGDSLVSNNNPLIAEGEIGLGRDVSQMVPGGYAAAGAVNGNLRTRAADVFLEGVLGGKSTATPSVVTQYNVADDLPWWSIEKKVGSTSPERMYVQYQDTMVNTLNVAIPAGSLATFSAGLITTAEKKSDTTVAATSGASYNTASDDLLVFHGGRIKNGATGGTLAKDETFQSIEIAINNNIAADEYTVRPSRFLRSLTEGIRAVDVNMTLVFENPAKYQQYEYGSSTSTGPGYAFYMGALEVFLGNWQLTGADTEDITTATPTGIGTAANPQAVQFNIPKLAFTGFPVALASGRIVVTTSARALKNTGSGSTNDIIRAYVRNTTAINAADPTAANTYYV